MELWTTDETSAKKYQLNTKLFSNEEKHIYTTWILFKDLEWFNTKLNWLTEINNEERTVTFDLNTKQIFKYLNFINTGELKELSIDDIIALYHQADYHLYSALKEKLKEMSINLEYTGECIKLYEADILNAEEIVDKLFKTINRPKKPDEIINNMFNNSTMLTEISKIAEQIGSIQSDPLRLMQNIASEMVVNTKLEFKFNYDEVKPLLEIESVKAILINRILNYEPIVFWNITKYLSNDEFKVLIEKYNYKVTQDDINKIKDQGDKYDLFVNRLETLKN